MLAPALAPSSPRARLAALLVVALAVAGCDRPAPAAPAEGAADRATLQPGGGIARTALPESGAPGATDPAAALEAAWNAGDAVGVAALYTEDTEIINPIGGMLAGRAAAQAGHAALFAGPYKGSHRTTQVDRVAYLTGTIAVVDLTSRLTNFVGTPPGLRPTAPGLIVQRERQIVVKRGGTWEIYMVQVTPVPPAP